MTTTVSKIIKTSGGDYSTLAAWFAACPADLVASNQIWQGQVDGEITVTSGVALTMSGITVDATRYVELTAKPGSSFIDNASVQSNPLRYDATKGAGITSSATTAAIISVGQEYCRINRLQIASTGASTSYCVTFSANYHLDINQCIMEISGQNTQAVKLGGANAIIRNSLIVGRKSSLTSLAQFSSGPTAVNCTFVVPSDFTAASNAVDGNYNTPVFKNCAFFGCTAIKTGGATPTYTTCRTNVASPPSGCTTTTYNTSAFVNITDATRDFRLPSGSALIDAGTTDSTNAGTDIAGSSRGDGTHTGSSYDVGAWEYYTAGSAATATTLSGPSSGAVSTASTNFSVGVDATPISGTLVVTPATSISSGGTFSPTSVSLTTGSPSATFTFTPSKSGAHSISISDNGGLTDASPVTYTVQPAVTVTLVAGPTDSTAASSLSSLKWAWWDATDPSTFGAPTDKGSSETTDGSGVLTIPLPNSTKTNGQVGWLLVTNSDGTVAQSPSGKTGGGPVSVT